MKVLLTNSMFIFQYVCTCDVPNLYTSLSLNCAGRELVFKYSIIFKFILSVRVCDIDFVEGVGLLLYH